MYPTFLLSPHTRKRRDLYAFLQEREGKGSEGARREANSPCGDRRRRPLVPCCSRTPDAAEISTSHCHGDGPLPPTPRVSSRAFTESWLTEAEVRFKISVGPLPLFRCTSFGAVPGLCLLPSLGSCVCLCACDYKHVCTCGCVGGCVCTPLCVCLWNTSVHPEVPCSAPNSLSQRVFLKA